MDKKTSKKVNLATLKTLGNMPAKSINNDRGLEFTEHKNVQKN